MDVMMERARELLAYQAELDGHVETAAAYRSGMFDTNPSVRALLVALAMAERFESQAVAAIEAAQIASRRADRSALTPPDGYVLVDSKLLGAVRVARLAILQKQAEAEQADEPNDASMWADCATDLDAIAPRKLLAARPEVDQ